MKNTQTRFAISVLATLYAVALRADTVELKTGERVDGAFRQATAAGVMIEIAGQAMTIPLAKVQAIYFGPAKPAAASAAPSPTAEALDALHALRSVTESGITFRDYAPRVLDAKIRVDRYLSSSADDAAELRGSIWLATREYELASRVWGASFQLDGVSTLTAIIDNLEPDILKNCPVVKKAIDRAALSTALRNLSVPDTAPVGPAPWALLWSCASASVGEADRLLTTPLAAPGREAPNVAAPKAASKDPVPGAVARVQHDVNGENDTKKPIVVRFSSLPADADVSIDGESRGYTPTMDFTDVAAGPHTIAMKKPGYQLWEQTIALAPGDNRTISADLKPEPLDPTKPRIVGN